MKIPIPPTGGQGGHYGGGATGRIRIFDSSPKSAGRSYVPRRFRGLRLRRRRRSRMTHENPMLTLVMIVIVAIPVLIIAGFALGFFDGLLNLLD